MAVILEKASPATKGGYSYFRRFAWGVLAYNILVVLWGAYVRATGSGAGCGNHWPLCNGEMVPRAPKIATVIEFSHRLTSGLAVLSLAALCIWSFRLFPRGHRARLAATLSLVFIFVEALLGAGLVLLRYVAQNASIGRAFYLSAHLSNTQFLLAAITASAWLAGPLRAGERQLRPSLPAAGLIAALIVSISGAIAALGDTLFPATSFAAGMRQEFSSTAHILLRLRLLHPALAIVLGVYLLLMAILIVRSKPAFEISRLSWLLAGLVLLQLIAGALNVVLLAPVWMQMLHLLLADLIWVTLVILALDSRFTAGPE